MTSHEIDVVKAFIEAINRRSVPEISTLMTEDHTFVDSRGGVESGREKMVAGTGRKAPEYLLKTMRRAHNGLRPTTALNGRAELEAPMSDEGVRLIMRAALVGFLIVAAAIFKVLVGPGKKRGRIMLVGTLAGFSSGVLMSYPIHERFDVEFSVILACLG